ncbi:hypothetical protein JVT61DRAFT_8083 [Boletus reticuloceps]|uniref:Uncharacterized protein n=1 Tax=Boletus reticuloceps TaxID=495285 RepID=A0A8I2YXN7_9AGAM|nr:hypothetical protein JVT61DRAFT_8083 [Boletus reticuloceps]
MFNGSAIIAHVTGLNYVPWAIYPKSGTIGLSTVQKWWGNTVFLNTAEGKKLPYQSLPANGMFGIYRRSMKPVRLLHTDVVRVEGDIRTART